MGYVIRQATPADAETIATIHVRSWQEAYRGIVPSEYLMSLSIDQREGVWRDILERDTSDVWVADEENAVLGWISVGGSRDSDASPTTGEVWAIYVDPRHWRRGVGRTLWNHARETLRNAGFARVTLWVLKENYSALAFYASVGFTVENGREAVIERGGAELVEVRLRLRLTG